MTSKQKGDTMFAIGKDGEPTNEKIHEQLLEEGDALIDIDHERQLAIQRGMSEEAANILFSRN